MDNQINASVTSTPLQHLLLYCRPGFEKECAAEIQNTLLDSDVAGYANAQPDSGFVLFTPYEAHEIPRLMREIRFFELIFARQLIFTAPVLTDLPPDDRITPLLNCAESLSPYYSEILLETADTNEAKSLSVFVRKFAGPLAKAATLRGMSESGSKKKHPGLHLFFSDSSKAYVGLSRSGNSSPWLMGIPRLKFPRSAPSRSTLKLEEAFHFFLGENPRQLEPAMTAVDLGAAPGGWTWQLVKRSIRVTAVDNGPMDRQLLESGIVEHVRADGFRFRPVKPVDWLVCDMVEQPARIARLVAQWMAEGLCRYAIFNLKLPMKKRYDEVRRCRELMEVMLDDAEVPFQLRFKQLYHDREEVTGYLARL
ncbi:23S rRNA (cytidine(2498)-2'-O)-methyltransferase RlmM [Candidatus Methylospira mobilis]|uniref:Ribosomal RNA large subunit methyltransferase M n=1 Tax=Candidatus Methylospira mobilis TaxID=1808979 RepID=A0A5Q0BKB0_9GAMM|nr:23S rRNA (cytidine(2498)-2'-O)-methyltransferase RlmM [Candidatus Methylospira mobilis]QFY44355.1 23S rRNA (cytidine(2498)-2'-O)-methyltransferase RlmM [Candidatus Methylospira mobilis]WNV06214.1 23S rRNA (cytidine(2498)-2'-O)-methyltransferase RlmM [Candidatus Methylospira mobilis]